MIRAATNPRLRATLTAALVLSLLGVAGTGSVLVLWQNWWSKQTEFTAKGERYLSALTDLETGYRGYVISGQSVFLAPYQAALTKLATARQELDEAASSAGFEDRDLAPLYEAAESKLDFAREAIAARNISFPEAQRLIETREGVASMDKARGTVGSLVEQSGLRLLRYAAFMKNVVQPVGIASIIALTLASAMLIYLNAKARQITVRSRSLLADVIERAPVGLALIDQHMKIDQMNVTFNRMLGDGHGKAAGQHLAAISRPLAEALGPKIADALRGRRSTQDTVEDFIVELQVEDSTRYIKADVFPITLVDTTGITDNGAGLVLNDVTRQREWEMELEEAKASAEAANRAKSAFLANMSHELRTPLTAVLGYTELIEDDLRDKGETEVLTDLNKITINARHLLQLINDVLDLSKIEAQKMDVHAVDFTIKSLFDEIEAATGSLLSKNENEMQLFCENPEQVLTTDDLKLKQILLNVISNAAKFTKNGKIEVRAEQIEVSGVATTRITVSDSGIGMSDEQLANLFKRFNQADETTTRKYGGTGLGLALTKALSRMLGGSVEVESKQGKGTTFTIDIPTVFSKQLLPDYPEVQAAMFDDGGKSESNSNSTILVVDDEPAARELLQRHLTREGFSVQIARSGTEALSMIAEKPPVAVLLDVMMPGLDGWHVLQKIRKDPATARIPVIMTTVLDEQNFAFAQGATGYLKKPVRRKELASALQAAASSADREVLIVDDDTAASERLKTMLHRDGWGVRMASNGHDALAMLKQRIPSLVLVDLIMPEMDGYAFIREVHKVPEFASIPLLVMTASDVSSRKVRELRQKTAGIVQKGAMPMADLVADLRRFSQN